MTGPTTGEVSSRRASGSSPLPPPAPAELDPEPNSGYDEVPQDLFPEAKRRERRRRLLVGCVVLAAVGLLVLGLVYSAGGSRSGKPPRLPARSSPSPAPLSPTAFLDLAQKGLSGNYELTYRVVGNPKDQGLGTFNGNGSVVVAQRALIGRASTNGRVDWSFLIKQTNGWIFQWIQFAGPANGAGTGGGGGAGGGAAETCERWLPRQPTLVCGGPSVNYGANGDLYSMDGFIPQTVVGSIVAAVEGAPANSRQLRVFRAPGTMTTGSLTCLSSTEPGQSGTWCITKQGRIASSSAYYQPPYAWQSIDLVSSSAAPPAGAMTPLAKPSLPEFVILPV
jgi:hypothetical protein